MALRASFEVIHRGPAGKQAQSSADNRQRIRQKKKSMYIQKLRITVLNLCAKHETMKLDLQTLADSANLQTFKIKKV